MADPVSCAEEPTSAGHSWWVRLFSQTFQQVHQGESLSAAASANKYRSSPEKTARLSDRFLKNV